MSGKKFIISFAFGLSTIGLFLFACKSTPPDIGFTLGEGAKSMTVSGYTFKLPSWWDSVQVDVPTTLKTENKVREYVSNQYGMDTGTRSTWKQAFKVWAIASQRLDLFPVYLAHCYKSGGELQKAAKVFDDLYNLAGSRGKDKDWYRVYLSYNAGNTYAQLGENDKAKEWFSRAARYTGSSNSDIKYYAGIAAKRLKAMEKQRTHSR